MQGQLTSPDQPGNPQQSTSRFTGSPSYSYQQAPSLAQHRTDGADRSRQLAKALAWFSIGLGVAQLLAPRRMSRAVGVADRPMLWRAIGAREIASGVGILTQRRSAGWLWSRVAGDMMDLALLGTAANTPGAQRSRVAVATAAVAGITVLDVMSSMQQSQARKTGEGWTDAGGVHVEKSITVNRSAEECYRFWRDFENFPLFMKHLESVQTLEGNRSHWKAKAPAGTSVEWDAEVTVDQPGQLLAWRSLEGADVDNAGTISFERAPGGRGTIVRAELQYSPPGGKAGALVAKLFGEEPSQQIDEDLRRFKQLVETGEITTTVGQPSGPRSAFTRLFVRKGAPG